MLDARLINLSQGGARVQGAAALPVGACGTIGLDGVAAALRFTVREADGLILGLAFTLDDAAAATLRSSLHDLASRHAA